jgi:ATP-binding cassette, subfamily A (ABC1), member 3
VDFTVSHRLSNSVLFLAHIILRILNLRFIPAFDFAKGLLFCINIEAFALLNANPNMTVWNTDILGLEIMFLAIQSILYPCLAVYFDVLSTRPSFLRKLRKFRSLSNEESQEDEIDEDVASENERVANGTANDDTIVMNKLTKRYPNGKLAVHTVSLGIPSGQCFGLLGINGAGKTTMLGILTAEFPATSGDATLDGFSVTSQPELTRRKVGYCPQFDAHFTNMTGREHVELYAAIKGLSKDVIHEAASQKLLEVGLSEEDSDRLSSEYSGGMKRKLSVACAMIGNPRIMFLDEPSTGMDPVSRRDLWNVISRMVVKDDDPSRRTCVILTTHSMEECKFSMYFNYFLGRFRISKFLMIIR